MLTDALAVLDLEVRARKVQLSSQEEMVRRGMSAAEAEKLNFTNRIYMPLPETHTGTGPGGVPFKETTFVHGMFDTPHIMKNLGGAVPGAGKRGVASLLDRETLLGVARTSTLSDFRLEEKALAGGEGLDRQSEVAKCCFFMNPLFWEAVKAAGHYGLYLMLKTVGEMLFALQRSGFTDEWRFGRLARFDDLFYMLMPKDVFKYGSAPQHIMGVSSGIWLGLKQIRDSIMLTTALHPGNKICWAHFSTYSIEQIWSFFVQFCMGYKPESRVLEAILTKMVTKTQLVDDETKPALCAPKKRARAMYRGMDGESSTTKDGWNNGRRLNDRGELDLGEWEDESPDEKRWAHQMPSSDLSTRVVNDGRGRGRGGGGAEP